MKHMKEYLALVKALSRFKDLQLNYVYAWPFFQVVLGLHIVRGDNICIVGEIDEDIDQRLDLHNIKADPLNPVPHGAH